MPAGKVDWNAGDYEAGGSFEPMPAADYLCMVMDSEQKQVRSGNGSYFEFEFDVIKPEKFKNRKLWARLNIHNPSDVAQRIGREQFNSLIEGCGKDRAAIKDTTQLHNLLVVCVVTIEENKLNGRKVNRVDGFRKPTAEGIKAAEGYQGRSRAAATASKPTPIRPRAGTGTMPEDDDIPFADPYQTRVSCLVC